MLRKSSFVILFGFILAAASAVGCSPPRMHVTFDYGSEHSNTPTILNALTRVTATNQSAGTMWCHIYNGGHSNSASINGTVITLFPDSPHTTSCKFDVSPDPNSPAKEVSTATIITEPDDTSLANQKWDLFYKFVAGTPTFDPPAGEIARGSTIALTSVTPDAVFYYTIDGSNPTTSSNKYTGPIKANGKFTLKAIATAPGYNNSAVASADYVDLSFAGNCAVWNAAIAARTATCLLSNPEYLAGRPGAIDCATIQADITAGQTTFDEAKGADCTTALQALPCASLVSVTPGPFALPVAGTACAQALVGKGSSGSNCHRDTQCASTFCNATATKICPGTCQTRFSEGAPCTWPAECASGLTCNNTTRKCAAYAALDASCLVDTDCSPELRCREQKCQKPLSANSVCNVNSDCAVGNVCINIICQPLVGLGGACVGGQAPAVPTACAAGYWCNGGTCAALPKVNESCASTWACIGGYCDGVNSEAKCQAYLKTGDTTSDKKMCASQLSKNACADIEKDKCTPALSNTILCAAPGDYYCYPQ